MTLLQGGKAIRPGAGLTYRENQLACYGITLILLDEERQRDKRRGERIVVPVKTNGQANSEH